MLYPFTQQFFARHKKVLIALSILACFYLGYHYLHSTKKPPQDIKTVEIEKATQGRIQQTARFIGTIKSEQATFLISKTKGILDRFINAGERVKKGDVIAKIINADVERNFKLSEEMEHLAKSQYDRFLQLSKKGVVAKSALEEKQSAWIEYQRRMSDAKIAMNDINLYAPFDGIVGIFKIREGSQVGEGEVIVSLYDPSAIIVEFDVPLSVLPLVKDGSNAFVDGKPYNLTYIQKMLDEETHMSPAYIRIQCEACIIGATVDIDLVVKENASAIIIPFEAIFLRNSKSFVYIIKDGKASLVQVEVGIRDKKIVQITSGLKKDDEVIVRGQGRLYPGALVAKENK